MATEIRASRPPEGFRPMDRWVLDTADQLTTLRASLHQALTGHDLPEGKALGRIPEKMVLVASELATNALKHGIPPTTVTLSCTDTEFLLDVADHDVDGTPHIAGERAPGAGGFGLYLAHKLSLDVGWFATPETKHVWAIFTQAAAEAVPASDRATYAFGELRDPRDHDARDGEQRDEGA